MRKGQTWPHRPPSCSPTVGRPLGVPPCCTSPPVNPHPPPTLRGPQEEALAELQAEMALMKESAQAALSRAQALEGSAASARDQLLRLNADFENFRRRTVRPSFLYSQTHPPQPQPPPLRTSFTQTLQLTPLPSRCTPPPPPPRSPEGREGRAL